MADKHTGGLADNTKLTVLGHQAANFLPVRVPFETTFTQVVGEGLQAKGTFVKGIIAEKNGEFKEMQLAVEYDFTPETIDTHGNVQLATVGLHIHALVTDLASNNSNTNSGLSNPPTPAPTTGEDT